MIRVVLVPLPVLSNAKTRVSQRPTANRINQLARMHMLSGTIRRLPMDSYQSCIEALPRVDIRPNKYRLRGTECKCSSHRPGELVDKGESI